mgnify:CR=1 FL=1
MKIRGQTVHSHEERLRRLSVTDEQTGCWNWTSSTRNGYGRLVIGSRADGTRKSVSAHRLSFETFIGAVPDGMEVCHRLKEDDLRGLVVSLLIQQRIAERAFAATQPA